MQDIVFEKPYEFVPAHRGNWWPSFAQRMHLVDYYLKRRHGVVAYECRNTDHLRQSLEAGHGILLTPNHCRPSDPLVLGFLTREVKTHVYAMASWHLYQQDWFTAWAIPLMGGFSVYREGVDRRAVKTAIEVLATAERPLVIFPEGAVTRTNDRLQALLNGVEFIALAAAKKRRRLVADGKVAIHPLALKYLFQGDLEAALGPVLHQMEDRLLWRTHPEKSLMERIGHVGQALLALKEVEYFGVPQTGQLHQRLSGLIDHLLVPLEQEWLGAAQHGSVVPRVKALRMKILPDMVRGSITQEERRRRWDQLADVYLAQRIGSYPPDYLTERPSVDRLFETVERYEEDLTDKSPVLGSLKVIIDVGEAIEVTPQRDRNADVDSIMLEIEATLRRMLDELSKESPIWAAEPNVVSLPFFDVPVGAASFVTTEPG